MNLSTEFWENKYKNNKIGWDLGEVSPPLKVYFDQLQNKELKILIPGGGNSYEAEYLFKLGFKSVFVVDVSKTALGNIKKRIPNFPESNLIHVNFFEIDIFSFSVSDHSSTYSLPCDYDKLLILFYLNIHSHPAILNVLN